VVSKGGNSFKKKATKEKKIRNLALRKMLIKLYFRKNLISLLNVNFFFLLPNKVVIVRGMNHN